MNKNFYNIDEVSQIVGEQKHTIRFWESRISKLKIIRTHIQDIGYTIMKTFFY